MFVLPAIINIINVVAQRIGSKLVIVGNPETKIKLGFRPS
jgi:hypothetical protein